MKLIFVRHGQTEENVKRITQCHSFGKLSKLGQEQIKKLALRLKDEKIDLIFSSDLLRVKETTKEIIKFHQVPIYYDKRLRERCSGIYEGKAKKHFYTAKEKSGLSIIEFKPEQGENIIEVKTRLQTFWNDFSKQYTKGTILISCHGRIIKILLGIIFDKPLEEVLKMERYNASITIVKLNGKPKMILNNDVEHLVSFSPKS